MLKGKKICLRPLKLSDWEKTIHWRNDPNIKLMSMMHPFPITEFLEKEWYEDLLKSKNNKVVYFAIVDGIDNPVGYIFLSNINLLHRNCNLGIVIGDIDMRGKGIGTDAITLISNYAFNILNLFKISIEVISINHSAIKVYEKLGFVHEGLLKEHFYTNGEYFDVLIMSLFKKDLIPLG